ncbi:MAG: hypothetical protein M0R41_08995 [Methylobacter tundripaludum]|uniref:Uncharacterized protein n=1 Tax=Methylobacter tundripaludum TaxID=173365 RepID=A0A2S6H6I1_9GAMM|nr:hypothetical protein [Methylobacter tundripaludum]MCK9636400.1 hypothetical protein [Methylobacter tundripaludum]PPK73092.1 hypothetical protein B0F88_10271 [Methylobacter tundripaludum]
MSEKDQQKTLLMAIEYLKTQYEALQNPCIALLISRYYRLLANLSIAKNKRGKYVKYSRHSQKMQNQLNDFIQPHECN